MVNSAAADTEGNARLLASYWGKADPEVATRGPGHHTVLGHSLDVAACAFILVERNPVLRTRLAATSGIPHDRVALTFAAVSALHDVGKIDTRFQRKAPSVADALRSHTTTIATGKYDHGVEGFRQLEDDDHARELAQTLLGAEALPLLRAVCGHHGGLPTRAEPDPSRTALPSSVRREDVHARRVFQETVVTFFVSLGASLPWPGEADAVMVQRLAGLCAIADWLGSNVEHFSYRPGPVLDLEEYWGRACDCAAEACGAAGLLRATASAVDFISLFPGYLPRDVQTLTERVHPDGPALVIVEAEMGKGKTEAALALPSQRSSDVRALVHSKGWKSRLARE